EALRPAGVPVHDNLRRLHGAVRLKEPLQITVTNAVGQVAHVQLLTHRGPPEKNRQEAPPTTAGRCHLAKYIQLHAMGQGKGKEWRKQRRGPVPVHETQLWKILPDPWELEQGGPANCAALACALPCEPEASHPEQGRPRREAWFSFRKLWVTTPS